MYEIVIVEKTLLCVQWWTWKYSLRWNYSLIRTYVGSRNKFSLVAQAAPLGNLFNLHNCKMVAARYANIFRPYTRTTCANIKFITSIKGSFVYGIQIPISMFYFKVMVSHWRSTNSKCGVLIGDAVDCLSTRHVIKMLSEFSNFRVSLPL